MNKRTVSESSEDDLDQGLPEIPNIVGNIRIYSPDKDTLLIRTINRTIKLSGDNIAELITPIFKEIDGNQRMEKVIKNLEAEGYERENLLTAFRILQDHHILVNYIDKDNSSLSTEEYSIYQHQIEFFSLYSIRGEEVQERLSDAQVMIINLGLIGSHIAHLLGSMGIGSIVCVDSKKVNKADVALSNVYREADIGKDRFDVLDAVIRESNTLIDFTRFDLDLFDEENSASLLETLGKIDLVVSAEDDLDPLERTFTQVNKWCINNEIPWIGAGIRDHNKIQVGPLVIPHSTACYECYRHHSRSNLPEDDEFFTFEDYLQNTEGKKESTSSGLVALVEMVSCIVAVEAAKYIGGFLQPSTINNIFLADPMNLEFENHRILKFPRCPVCSRLINRPLRQVWEETQTEN